MVTAFDALAGVEQGRVVPAGTQLVENSAKSTSGSTETFALADGEDLTLKVDQGAVETVTFTTSDFNDIANATADEVAAAINLQVSGVDTIAEGGAVIIQSNTVGLTSFIEVTGGTANAALSFPLVEFQGSVSGFAYCLGSDTEGRFHMLNGGDFLELEQNADFDDTVLLRFFALTTPPEQMPTIIEIPAAAVALFTVTVGGTGFSYTGLAADTVNTIAAELVALINAGAQPVKAEQWVDGQFGITLDDPEVPIAVSVTANMTIHTATWRASLRVDAVERAFALFDGVDPRQRNRVDMGANVEALAGAHDLQFRLELISTAPGLFSVELPRFCVDQLALPIT